MIFQRNFIFLTDVRVEMLVIRGSEGSMSEHFVCRSLSGTNFISAYYKTAVSVRFSIVTLTESLQ